METSYFGKSLNNPKAVSIAITSPPEFKGKHYKKLAPPFSLLIKYKKDGNALFYTKHYYSEVLNKLNPKQVFEDLGEDAVLLCWERSGTFCHRHLVAQWLTENLKINIREI